MEDFIKFIGVCAVFLFIVVTLFLITCVLVEFFTDNKIKKSEKLKMSITILVSGSLIYLFISGGLFLNELKKHGIRTITNNFDLDRDSKLTGPYISIQNVRD